MTPPWSVSQVSRSNILNYAAWLATFLFIGLSLREPAPIFWDDSPAFVQSALISLANDFPTTVGGRDAGYPVVLAVVWALGGNLATVVGLQEAAWVVMLLLVAWTAVHVTDSHLSLILVVLLAIYPGGLIYRHIILADGLYSVALTASGCLAALAVRWHGGQRVAALAAGVLFAAVAACLKSSGLLAFVLVALFAILAMSRKLLCQSGMVIAGVMAASVLVAGSIYVRASSADPHSRIFIQKTFFCNHSNIFLASDAAKQRATALLGRGSGRFLALVQRDLESKKQVWPTLGFYGDACMFDGELDLLVESGNSRGIEGISDVYRSLFIASLRDRPIDYARKIARQLRYGLVMAWPPHALGPTLTSSDGGYAAVAALLIQNKRPVESWMSGKPSVSGWFLSTHGDLANYLFRAVSLLVAATVVMVPIGWVFRSRLDLIRLKQLTIVSLIWLASISTAALSLTLDIWRYIASATPLAALIIVLGAALFRDCFRHERVEQAMRKAV